MPPQVTFSEEERPALRAGHTCVAGTPHQLRVTGAGGWGVAGPARDWQPGGAARTGCGGDSRPCCLPVEARGAPAGAPMAALWAGSRAWQQGHSREQGTGSDPVAEQVFGQKDEWVEFHAWQVWGAWQDFATFQYYCPICRPRGGGPFIFLLFFLFLISFQPNIPTLRCAQ